MQMLWLGYKIPFALAKNKFSKIKLDSVDRTELYLLSALLIALLFLVLTSSEKSEAPVLYGYKVVAVYPHDPSAFTQGLVFDNGSLYESTGLYGSSTIRKVDLESGRILQIRSLPANYFGEGIAIVGDKIFQLTWRERRGFVYDKQTFELLGEFSYPTEGWGLTFDGKRLIMSDGSTKLYFLDPENFEILYTVEVRDGKKAIANLNELEFVEGFIYANVWMEDRIAIIEPENGRVVGWIELSGIYTERKDPEDVLNGIAYDREKKRLFVTGKRWSKLSEIEIMPKQK
jgi:glutamine cyclotransferase